VCPLAVGLSQTLQLNPRSRTRKRTQAKSVLPAGVELKEAAGGEPLEPQPSWVEGTTRIADLLVPHERDAVQTFRCVHTLRLALTYRSHTYSPYLIHAG
jgi:hypothetical protein